MINNIKKIIKNQILNNSNFLKIINNIGWLFFDKILRMGVGLIVGVWIARYLGPEQFGVLSYAFTFVALFAAVAALGLNEIVVRNIVREPQNFNVTLGSAFALQLIASIFVFVLMIVVLLMLHNTDYFLIKISAIIGGTLLLQCSSVFKYWFESQVKSKYIVWIENSSFLLFSAVKIIMILNGSSLISFAWIVVIEALLNSIGLLAIYIRQNNLAKWYFRIIEAKSLIKDSWPLIFAGVAVTLYMKIDQIMLGQMISNKAVGIYSAAVRVSEVWYFIPMVVTSSVLPSIIESKKKSENSYKKNLQMLYNLMVLLSLAIAIPMTFLSDWIVNLLFGSAYQEAGPILAVHIWASVFVFLGVASSQWFLIENKQILALQRTAIGALINIVLNLFLIPLHGAIGAAWATVISYSVSGFFYDAFQRKTRDMFLMKIKAINLFYYIRELSK